MEILPKLYAISRLEKLSPKFSYNGNENITSFQRSGRKALSELIGLPNIEKGHTDGEVHVTYDRYDEELDAREIKFTFESERGLTVPCYLLIPRKRNENGSPLILALHGHSTGVHTAMGRTVYPIDRETISNQQCDFAKQGVKRGYCVLLVEHRGFGERGGTEKGSECSLIAMQALMLGRTLLGERVFDTMCALDAVCNYFSDIVRFDNTVCIGYSGGGTVATYLSALDTRISTTVIVSAISTYSKSIGAIKHCPCNYVPHISEYFDMGEICQLIAPRKLLVVSGKDDPIFPFTGAKEAVDVAKRAYSVFESADNITHIAADGGHRFYPDEVWEYINEIYK